MFAIPHSIPSLIAAVIQLLVLLIVADVVISYLIMFRVRLFGKPITPYTPVVQWVRRIVDPLLNPIRRALPPYRTGNLDFSPMIVILLLQAIASVISRY